MSRVVTKQQRFDEQLVANNQVRIYRCEYVTTASGLASIFREHIVNNDANDFDRTPWWKRIRSSRRQKK